jgi:ferredoxin
VGDSPSGAAKLARVWEATGVAAVCAEEDVPLISFEKAGSRRFESGDCAFRIARPVLDAAVLINLPKVKTHILTTLTGAVKNLYGAVPGYQKMHLHKAFPSATAFSRLLAAIYRSVPPALHIADGVVGMEGDGPSGGRPVALGFLAAAADGVALDMTLCRLLRVNPVSVPYLAQLAPDEDSRARYARVAVAGTPLEDLAPPGFALPRLTAARLLPRPLIRLVERFFWIRPSFSERCVRCGRCVEACPVQALALPEGCRTAVLAPARCIGCCCCHEICPEGAVTMTPSAVLRLLRRGKERS